MKQVKHAPKIRETSTLVNGRQYPRVVVDFGIVDGKRKRRTFKTMAQAERAVATWQAEQKILANQIGKGARRFLTGDVQDAAAAIHILGPGVTLSEAAALFRAAQDSLGPGAKLTDAVTMFKAAQDAELGLDHIRDAGEAVKTLGGKASLADAAKFYKDRHFPGGCESTVDALVEEYLDSRRKVDRRPGTLHDIRARLGCGHPRQVERKGGGVLHLKPSGFANDFAGVSVAHVTTADLERWMERHSGKAKSTYNGFRVHLVGLFNFAKARKYCPDNPADALETPRLSKKSKRRPYVLPVEDADAILRYAAAHEPGTVPYFALGLFAGIRPRGELGRLRWEDINFDRREIDIRADVSKTGDERFVDMSKNLVAWLLPHRKASGLIVAQRNAIERVRRGAGIRWEPDCMRHSFGSYHMAHFRDAGETALQMGHRTIDTTFEHYRRAVRKKDAERFWEIRPDEKSMLVRFPKAV